MDIFLAQRGDALQIAKIHEQEIKNAFLSSLKSNFLCKFYEAIIVSKGSFCFVAKEKNMIVGFIAGVTNIDDFYRYFFKNYFFVLIPVMLPNFFNFRNIKKIFETILYPKKTKDLPKAELLTIAVNVEFQGKGLGNKLLGKFILKMKNKNIHSFKVLVGKELSAVKFYQKNGFKILHKINIHGKEESSIFIYKIP